MAPGSGINLLLAQYGIKIMNVLILLERSKM